MNWEEIGAIGQLLGTIAVLVTLVYLSIQVRHAREQAMRSAERARCDAAREYFLALATQPELSGAWETFSSVIDAANTVCAQRDARPELVVLRRVSGA